METQPTLFGDAPAVTTRGVATLVRNGGIDALPSAERLADAATYQEVVCRSALNAVKGMPFRWTLNPYRGCTHACAYCFARRYQRQLELDAGDQFSSVILVKANLPAVLARELRRGRHRGELVALGTATDPYQPIEGRYRLTRRCLELLSAAEVPVGMVTKGPMVMRDAEVLAHMTGRAGVTVYMSVPTVDDVWQRLEPGTAPPLQRLRAVQRLRAAGVRAGVLMSPVVPGFTTQPARLARTLAACAEHDVPVFGGNLLHLDGDSRTHFLAFLDREAPHLRSKYDRIYEGKYAAPAYAREVKAMLTLLRDRYDVAGAGTTDRPRDQTDWIPRRLG
jgi:DNA repair photolyase